MDKSLIEKMNLQKLLNMHPYDLSGGEQQKVALAKVLGEKPAVLLLDEPTKGIDNIYKEQLGILLRDLAENGKTISKPRFRFLWRVFRQMWLVCSGKFN